MFLLNLLLTLAWLLLTGQFTPANFLFGFSITYLLLWLFQRGLLPQSDGVQPKGYFLKVWQLITFSLFFVKELLLANVRVAIDVLRFRPQMAPALITVPLPNFSDAEVTLLANFITLTPGTLSLDVVAAPEGDQENQGRMLRIHAMHAGRTQRDIQRFCTQLEQQYVRRVQEVMRS